MAKKIVKVNEEEIGGYMVGDIHDAVEKEDVIVVEVPAEETDKRQDKKTALEHPEPRPKRKNVSGFRQKYLVNTPMSGRIQVYLEPQTVRRDKELSPCDSSPSKYCELYQ